MNKMMRSAVLGAAVLSVAAGCGLNNNLGGVQPGATLTITPGADLTEAQQAQLYAQAKAEAEAQIAEMGYSLQAAGDAEIAVDEVTSSSVRNDYFRLSYLTDGNVHSAWNPAPGDAAPWAAFDLPDAYRISSFKVKVSPAGVTMDVAVDDGSGTWTTVATGLVPSQYEQLVSVDLPAAVDAEKVKITFHPAAGQQTSVCEVHWFGQLAPEPTPEPTPVATPTPTPSTAPSATPTPRPTKTPWCPPWWSHPTPTPKPTKTPKPTPTPKPCAMYMSGVGSTSTSTFVFLAGQKPGKDVDGFVYVTVKGRCFIGRVDVLQQQGDTVTVSGKLCGSNEAYTMVATDDGRNDDFAFYTGTTVKVEGEVRCGNIKFDEVCAIKDHKSTCYTKRWGKCFR